MRRASLDDNQPESIEGEASHHASHQSSSSTRVSRSGIASEIDSTFNLDESTAIATSMNTLSNPSLVNITEGIDHNQKCIKHHTVENNNQIDNNSMIDNLVLQRAQLHEKKVRLLLCPSQSSGFDYEKALKALEKLRKRRKLKDDENSEYMEVRKFAQDLLKSLTVLERDVATIKKSGNCVSALEDALGELIPQVYKALKVPESDARDLSSDLALYMQDRDYHPEYLTLVEYLLSMDAEDAPPSERIPSPSLCILRDGAALQNRALEEKMDPETFVQLWNEHEKKIEANDKLVILVDGLYVDMTNGRVVIMNEDDDWVYEDNDVRVSNVKNVFEVVPPGGYWLPNKMSTVRVGQYIILVAHWHPPSEGGVSKLESNGCIICMTHLGPSVLHSEAGGLSSTDVRKFSRPLECLMSMISSPTQRIMCI